MRHRSLIAGIALVIAATIFAPAFAGANEVSSADIVANCARAMGGDKPFDALATLRVGIVFPDHDYPVVMNIKRPNQFRTEGGDRYILVFDGRRAAFLKRGPANDGSPRGPSLVDESELVDFDVDMAFFVPAFFDHPAEFLGIETVEGRMAHVLRVDLPMGGRITYSIDAETHLPITAVSEVAIDGKDYRQVRVFMDFSSMAGVTYFQKFSYAYGDHEPQVADIVGLDVDIPMDEDLFKIPASLE